MTQCLLSLPSNRAFVVQFRLPSADRPMMWEGRVEHVVSRQCSVSSRKSDDGHASCTSRPHCRVVLSLLRSRTWS